MPDNASQQENLQSGMKAVTQVPETKVQAYEREARSLFGSTYAIGTSSGTGTSKSQPWPPEHGRS